MIVYGFHAVLARLRRSPASFRELLLDASRDDARMRDLVRAAQDAGLRPVGVDSHRLDRLCPQRRHQGVVAFVDEATPVASLDDLLDQCEGPPFLVLLDGVTDPRNLGACLRVADGAGVNAVVAPKDRACALTEVALQTASGAAESVPYVMVTNLARTLDDLQERGIWTVGAVDDADRPLYSARLTGALALVLGAEGRGLRRLTRERCDELVSIPMAGAVSSLNVAVATGVMCYEAVRQRRFAGPAAAG